MRERVANQSDAAQRSLDGQHFIGNKDAADKVLPERRFRAANRDVRVRLLPDDLATMTGGSELPAIVTRQSSEYRVAHVQSCHPAFARLLAMVADFGRINQPMHNKSFTGDGRNIGDECFEADAVMNFADLDVAVIGPVVREVSDAFDLYWNNQSAIPIGALARQNMTLFGAQRTEIVAEHETAKASGYGQSLRDSQFARQLRNRNVPYYWGKATIVQDHPDKVATSAAQTETHLAPQLRAVVDKTQRELFLVSPYFVPGKEGVALLPAVRQRGPRVVVITTSLASTDGVPVHSKYQRYRLVWVTREGQKEVRSTFRARRQFHEASQSPGDQWAADRVAAPTIPPKPPHRTYAPISHCHFHAAARSFHRLGVGASDEGGDR